MTYKYKTSNGLSVLGLGLLGGALLWWGLRRRVTVTSEPFRLQHPASSKSMPSHRRQAAQVTAASSAETAWPEEAAAPTRSQPQNRAKLQTVQETKPRSSTPEDFTPIEGIGPKINKVLHDAGITTFAQLAETEVSDLGQVLGEAGLRLAQADTWPEQARLAAEGKWDELRLLQDELDAGRRRE